MTVMFNDGYNTATVYLVTIVVTNSAPVMSPVITSCNTYVNATKECPFSVVDGEGDSYTVATSDANTGLAKQCISLVDNTGG